MTFAPRFALVVLAAFFLATVVTSLAAYLAAGPVLRAAGRSGASARAWTLALFRLLPAAAALATTAFVLAPGYYRHEQRAELEGVGLVLACAAGGGLLILLASIARTGRAIAGTARLRRDWLRGARPVGLAAAGMPAFEIDAPFPLVAVLGVVRPRLFLSRSVLRSCTPAELTAIVEHERGHVAGFDNAVRLLMDAAPDALALTRRASAVGAAWHQAAEHRADDAAAAKTELASALVRVARLAGEPRLVPLPASALFRGESIEGRVRRLLGAPESSGGGAGRPLAVVAGACAIACAAAALSAPALEAAHRVLEAAVSLP